MAKVMSEAVDNNLPQQARGLARLLGGAIKRLGMYPPGHPAVEKAIDAPWDLLAELMAQRGELTLAIKGERLLVGDFPLEKGVPAFDKLLLDMEDRKVEGVTLLQGLRKEELRGFLEALSLKPDLLHGRGGMASFLEKRGIEHIRVNEVRMGGIGQVSQPLDKEAKGWLQGEVRELLGLLESDPSLLGERVGKLVEDKPPQVKGQLIEDYLHRIASALLEVYPGPRRIKRYMAQLILSLNSQLKGWLQKGEGGEAETEDRTGELVKEILDEVRIDLIVKELTKEGASLNRAKGLVGNLFQEGERERIFPLLEEKLSQAGISKENWSWIRGKEQRSKESILKRAEEISEKEKSLLTNPEEVYGVVHGLLSIGEEKVVGKMLSKFAVTLGEGSPQERVRIAQNFSKLLNILLKADQVELLDQNLEALAERGGKEPDNEVFQVISSLLKEQVLSLIEKGRYGSASTIIHLLGQLTDPQAGFPLEHRLTAARVLRGIGTSEIVSQLVERIVDGEDRREIANILSDLGTRDVAEGLLKVFTHPDRGVRQIALHILTQIGENSLGPLTKLLQQKFARGPEGSFEDEDWWVVRNSIYLLGEIGQEISLPLLKGWLEDPDYRVRLEVIKAMEKIESFRAVPFLIRAIADPRDEVKRAAIVALGTIGDKDAVSPLVEVYPDLSKEERSLVISALGNIGDPQAIDFLLSLMEEKRPRWKKILGEGREEILPTLKALGKIGDPQATSKIEDFISQTGDDRLLIAAKQALSMIKQHIKEER